MGFWGYLKGYLRETTVHGFRYVVDGHGPIEKILWIISILTSFTLSAIMIKANIDDTIENPISTSINTIPVQDVPFPAVTLTGTYLKSPGRLIDTVWDTFKFDCLRNDEMLSTESWDEDKRCMQETSDLRLDLQPLLKDTARSMYEHAYKKVSLYSPSTGGDSTQHLDNQHLCSHTLRLGHFQSMVLKLGELYDRSNDTFAFKDKLFELHGTTFRTPEYHLEEKMADFILGLDGDYTRNGCSLDSMAQLDGGIDCCKEFFKTANFSNEAKFFTYAVSYAMTRYTNDKTTLTYPQNIPLGKLLSRSRWLAQEAFMDAGRKNKNLEKIDSKFRLFFSDILDKSATIYVNATLAYLDSIKSWNSAGRSFFFCIYHYLGKPAEQFCTTKSSGPCCNLEVVMSRELPIVWKIMKYMIAPPGREANEKSERRDRLLVKGFEYTLVNEIMKNSNPVFLACKYEDNAMRSNCNLIRKLFTTKGFGYTFNNEAFYKMFKNTPSNNAFFEEFYQMIESDDRSPRFITLNGRKRSFEFILNHIEGETRSSTDKLVIHDPYTIADARNEAIDLEPGMMYDIFVTPSVTFTDHNGLKLDSSKRNCLSSSENGNLKLFDKYSQSACLLECQLEKAVDKCNCSAWNYPRLNNRVNLCWKRIATECFEEQMEELDPKGCICPNDCNSIHYGIGMKASPLNMEAICNSIQLPHTDISKIISDSLLPTYPFFTVEELIRPKTCEQRVKETISFVRVSVAPKTVSQIVRTARVSFSGQLASLGGIIGLFTGMSILSLAEMLFWILRSLFSWLS